MEILEGPDGLACKRFQASIFAIHCVWKLFVHAGTIGSTSFRDFVIQMVCRVEASTMENRLLNAKTSYRLFHSKFYSRDQTRSIFFHALTRKNLTYNIFRNFLYSQVICQYGNYINLDCCRYVYDIIERVDNYQWLL